MSDHDATRALRAMAHPLRLQILSLLTGAELSAAEVARELDITHANASYHLRVLLEAGELEIASEERIRGGNAKRYRHPWQRQGASGDTDQPGSRGVRARPGRGARPPGRGRQCRSGTGSSPTPSSG